jgi:hypothetical protein
MSATLAAEWTKLTSTRMFASCASLAFGLSVAVTMLLAVAMNSAEAVCAQPGRDCHGDPLRPDVLISTAGMIGDNTPGPGLAVLMVLAALMVSVEYRYKTIGTTFMVTPQRSVVLLAKMAIAVAVALVIGLLAIVCSTLAFQALGGRALDAFDPTSGLAVRMYATVPAVAMVSAAMAAAVASLTRNSVVAVVLVVAWPSIGEPLLTFVPGIGSEIASVLPFVNARHFIGLDGPDPPWAWQASGVYFLSIALALVAAALVHQARTDTPTT